ncbi:MAG: hypothetical protein WDZ28_02145 [Simkaniaceae bacterium]
MSSVQVPGPNFFIFPKDYLAESPQNNENVEVETDTEYFCIGSPVIRELTVNSNKTNFELKYNKSGCRKTKKAFKKMKDKLNFNCDHKNSEQCSFSLKNPNSDQTNIILQSINSKSIFCPDDNCMWTTSISNQETEQKELILENHSTPVNERRISHVTFSASSISIAFFPKYCAETVKLYTSSGLPFEISHDHPQNICTMKIEPTSERAQAILFSFNQKNNEGGNHE